MHRSAYHSAGFLLIATLCGGCGQDEPSGLSISFAEQALLADAANLAIYFYQGGTACDAIRASTPRPTSVLGPYLAPLDDPGRQSGIVFRLEEVPAGVYTVFVDALDINNRNVGTGCAPEQRVFNQEVSAIQVVIGP